MNKLALGTVQFGLDYGINNQQGKIPESEIDKVLKSAFNNQIDTLDTSFAYGNSEKIIGQSLQRTSLSFNIVSKLPKTNQNPEIILNQTLSNIFRKELYGYLIHHFDYYIENPRILNFLKLKKEEGILKKIGFSLYYPKELDILIENKISFDLVQIPYSIFDRRFEKYFGLLKSMGVEIHVRSVFLQGLFFIDPPKLPSHFQSIKSKLTLLKQISKEEGIQISHICLCFAAQNAYVDKIVIGVDNEKNLLENLDYIEKLESFRNVADKLDLLSVDDENILLPFNWK